MTAHDKEVLERLGFKIGSIRHKSNESPMWHLTNCSATLTVYEDKSWGLSNNKTHTTYNNSLLSGKFRSIIAELRREGVVK